ncbi:hypothetical protein RDI58_015444 [Solanum bulbocastanum]|uniref:Uncharacterized protein n=1 Tax=Solanum bulbocastanum TaxID=147425 RepID=A0AAN8THS3_SOLBU
MPEDGISYRLQEIKFGSFIPDRNQSIVENKGEDSDSASSIQLEPCGGALNGTQMVVRRLQFSESSTSARPTPGEKTDYEDNRNVKQGLPVGYWSSEALSKGESAIGKPLYTDSFTASMTRISYARVLVEADVSQPLLDSIDIVIPTGSIQQQIEYDWRPKFCSVYEIWAQS